MGRAKNEPQKQTRTPSQSFLKSASAQIMKPRLMVILSAAALMVLGLVTVFSASSITGFIEQGDAYSNVLDQIKFLVLGAILCVLIILFCSQEQMRGKLGLIFYGLFMFLILIVPIAGFEALGAKRWINLGFASLQPSEFAKIALCIMAARISCDYKEGKITQAELFIGVALLVILPLGFMFITQSDLGTTAICAVALLAILALSGIPLRYLLIIIGVLAGFVLVAIFTQSYRLDRMMIFTHPWDDAGGDGYQLIHSYKAFAAGGLIGAGIGKSYERLYLPEAETDFIFAVLGEEMGFVGAVIVITLFLIFLLGGLKIARQASTNFGFLVAGSLTTMIVAQAFVNIWCVVGLFPVTGKPLPFLSSGGSSLLSSLMITGIILAISFDSTKTNKHKERRDNLRVVSTYSQPSISGRSSQRGGYSSPRQYSGRTSSYQRENVIPLQMRDFAAGQRHPHRTQNVTGRR